MEDKVNAIRNKTGIVNDNTSHVNMQGDVNIINKLLKRIELLETAVSLVMETQTKLLQENKK